MPAPSVSVRGLLAEVRQQPALLLRELLWRWMVGAVLLSITGLAAWRVWSGVRAAVAATGALQMTTDRAMEDPAGVLAALHAGYAVLLPAAERMLAGLLPLCVFCWVMAYALGRAHVLRGYDARLRVSAWELGLLELLRLGWMVVVSLLSGVLLDAAARAAQSPGPGALLAFALSVAGLGLSWVAWVWGARRIEMAGVLSLVNHVPVGAALRTQASNAGVRAVRRAGSRARWCVAGFALLLSLVPVAPSGVLWWVWSVVATLLLLAASGAVRLAVLLALIGVVRTAGWGRGAAADPGVRNHR